MIPLGSLLSYLLPDKHKPLSSKATAIFCRASPYQRNASLGINERSKNVSLIDSDRTKDVKILGKSNAWNKSLEWQIQDATAYGLLRELLYLGGDNWIDDDQVSHPPTSPLGLGLDKWGGNFTVIFDFMNLTNPRQTVADMIDAEYLKDSALQPLQLIASQFVEHVHASSKGF